jgi:hypothetical protein
MRTWWSWLTFGWARGPRAWNREYSPNSNIPTCTLYCAISISSHTLSNRSMTGNNFKESNRITTEVPPLHFHGRTEDNHKKTSWDIWYSRKDKNQACLIYKSIRSKFIKNRYEWIIKCINKTKWWKCWGARYLLEKALSIPKKKSKFVKKEHARYTFERYERYIKCKVEVYLIFIEHETIEIQTILHQTQYYYQQCAFKEFLHPLSVFPNSATSWRMRVIYTSNGVKKMLGCAL